MSEKKKTTHQSAKIIPLHLRAENHRSLTATPQLNENKPSEVFFNTMLQLDQILKAHFQDSTKVDEGK